MDAAVGMVADGQIDPASFGFDLPGNPGQVFLVNAIVVERLRKMPGSCGVGGNDQRPGRLGVQAVRQAQSRIVLLAPQHADQAVLEHFVDRVHGDLGGLVHAQPARAAGDDRDVDFQQRLVQAAVGDAHPAAGANGRRRPHLRLPAQADPLADRFLDPASREAGDLLVEELVEPLARVALADEKSGGGLAHAGPTRQRNARSICRFAGGISSAFNSSSDSQACSRRASITTSPSGLRAKKTWKRSGASA